MFLQEIWVMVKYPVAFSFVIISAVLVFVRLKSDLKDVEKIKKDKPSFKRSLVEVVKTVTTGKGKCTRHSDFKGVPPEGVNYAWCRLYKGGESYGGEVILDEDRLKVLIGEGRSSVPYDAFYPVPYERHQDITETNDPKKLSIQLDGLILVQDKPLTSFRIILNDRSDKVKDIPGTVDDGIIQGQVLSRGAIEGEVVSQDKLFSEYLATGNERLLAEIFEKENTDYKKIKENTDYKKIIEGEVLPKEDERIDPLFEIIKAHFEEKNKTIDVVPEKVPDYKKMIEDGIETKEKNIQIEGMHDGMEFKLDIKSE